MWAQTNMLRTDQQNSTVKQYTKTITDQQNSTVKQYIRPYGYRRAYGKVSLKRMNRRDFPGDFQVSPVHIPAHVTCFVHWSSQKLTLLGPRECVLINEV